jgi:hypothetical protein
MTIGLYAQVEQQADRAAADQLGELFMRGEQNAGPNPAGPDAIEPPSCDPGL